MFFQSKNIKKKTYRNKNINGVKHPPLKGLLSSSFPSKTKNKLHTINLFVFGTLHVYKEQDTVVGIPYRKESNKDRTKSV
jgi:hypothetical protein